MAKRGFLAFVLLLSLFTSFTRQVHALESFTTDSFKIELSPIPCNSKDASISCPTQLINQYANFNEYCATSLDQFKSDPTTSHYWVEDPEITAQGKSDERARQFIYWSLNTSAIDESSTLKQIWGISSTVAFFFTIIVAAVFGIGFIISRRTSFQLNIQIWPTVIKIGIMLLWIALSASIVLILIQLSEILMKFFIERLGGNQLFNIYFSGAASGNSSEMLGRIESNYKDFVGCRDLNIRVQEGVKAEMFLLQLTNITYYIMGVMLLLRKILLWFLLFVSPFLAILMPFVFIRNTGWIWIGVFFQWLFYGPLFALFLGAMATIWKAGIPFTFDFSRVKQLGGYVYPTGINILYGGPAQIGNKSLGAFNNGNYIDTFAEYVITLIMLWAVTFFPWWLLRIFRDYCCDGIYAARNILLAMYNQMQNPPATPPEGPTPQPPNLKVDLPKDTQIKTTLNLESIEKIRNLATTDISKTLNLSATKLGDIARVEMNQQTQKTVQRNLNLLSNPMKAQTPVERQQYMNLRTELFARAIKNDSVARNILAATSTSKAEQVRLKQEMIKTISQGISVSVAVSLKTKIAEGKVNTITKSFVQSISNSNTVVNNIAKNTNTSAQQVKEVLQSYAKNTSMPLAKVTDIIASETKVAKDVVKNIIAQASAYATQASTLQRVALRDQISHEQISNILDTFTRVINKGQSIVQNAYKTITTNNTYIEQIHNETGASNEEIKTVLESYPQKQATATSEQAKSIMASASNLLSTSSVVDTIATSENVSKEQVKEALQTATQNISSETATVSESQVPVVRLISEKIHVPEAKAEALTKSIVSSIAKNESVVSNIQKETGLNQQQVQNVLKTYAQNLSQPASVIAQRINQSAGIAAEKVPQVMSQMSQSMMMAQGIVDEVAQKEGVKAEDVQQVIGTQSPLATDTEQHIEEAISIPSTISLEDYANVKQMWTQQYQSGSVPVTDVIKSREEWLDQDVVVITNTLNKLMSSDEKLREEGLDDLGYTLPIFMINNMKGEEILAYMKAKLESAKSVKQELEKAKNVKLAEEDDEEFVDVTKKKIEEKHMAVEDETPEYKPKETEYSTPSVRDYDESALDRNKEIKVNIKYTSPSVSVSSGASEVAKSLNMAVSKLTDIANMEKNKETRDLIRQNKDRLIQSTNVSRKEMLRTLPQFVTSLQNVATSQTNLSTDQGTSITNNYIQSISNSTVINNIAKSTNTSSEQVKQVLNSYLENISAPVKDIANTIAKNTNTTIDKVKEILNFTHVVSTLSQIFHHTVEKEKVTKEQVTNVLNSMSETSTTPNAQPAVESIARTLVNALTTNDNAINTIAQETNLNNQQIKTVLNTYAKNISKPTDDLTHRVLKSISYNMIMSKDLVEDVAEKTGVKPEDVEKTMNNQLPTVTDAEKNIEKTIAIPDSVSLEDYEEVKNMWNEQYEEGEVPVTENIKSREEWLSQDIVIITNALNKLTSNDETLREQGLDDVGLILPIFMANNLKSEEMLVYLKAKLESAKAVQKELEKEKQIQASLEKQVEDTQEFVDVAKKKIEEKHMAVEEELNSVAKSDSSSPISVSNAQQEPVEKSYSPKINISVKTDLNLKDLIKLEINKQVKTVVNENKQTILDQTRLSKMELLKSLPQALSSATLAAQTQSKLSSEKVTSITNTYIQNISNSSETIDSIAKKTMTDANTVKNVLITYQQNADKNISEILPAISSVTNVPIDKVKAILKVFSSDLEVALALNRIKNKERTPGVMKAINQNILLRNRIFDTTAQKEGVKVEDVENVLGTQLPLATDTQNNVEKTIAIPDSISLDDYEEMKNMWINQYENGEIPVTENIKSRDEWIDTDIVMITNTLNKLLSPDEKVREQGLDEIGFILPIVMVNNVSGEDLLVYLKAKLEAAKTVQKELQLIAQAQQEATQEEVFVPATPQQESQPLAVDVPTDTTTTETPLDKLKKKLEENSQG